MTTDEDHRQTDDFDPWRDQPSPNLLTRLRDAIASVTASLNSPLVKITAMTCLSVLVVFTAAAYLISRRNPGDASKVNPHSFFAAQPAPHSIAKPSPIGHAYLPLPAPPPAPVTRVAPQPAPVPAPQISAAAPPPAVIPNVRPAAPTLPLGVRMNANRNGFNNGCKHGELVMEVSTVTFTCPYDAHKSVAVHAAEVKSLDNNGIVVFHGQKYHFDIAGKQKQDVHELFAQWLANARRPSSAQASN